MDDPAIDAFPRKDTRIVFKRALDTRIIDLKGTWYRQSTLLEISGGGAKLGIDGSLAGLKLDEFFLLLTSCGQVARYCQKTELAGDKISVAFLKFDQTLKQGFSELVERLNRNVNRLER